MVNKVTFAGFRGVVAQISPPGSAPLVTRESSWIDGKDSEPKAQVKLPYLSSQKKINFFQRHILSKAFYHFPNVRKRTNAFREEARPRMWKDTKIYCNTIGGASSQIWPFPRVKTMLGIPWHPFIVNEVSDGYPVRQPFVTNLSAVETKLTGFKKL